VNVFSTDLLRRSLMYDIPILKLKNKITISNNV